MIIIVFIINNNFIIAIVIIIIIITVSIEYPMIIFQISRSVTDLECLEDYFKGCVIPLSLFSLLSIHEDIGNICAYLQNVPSKIHAICFVLFCLAFDVNSCLSFGNICLIGTGTMAKLFRARFLSFAWSKLRLCSANHRPGYWSNLPCDWPSTAWAYSELETENGPRGTV